MYRAKLSDLVDIIDEHRPIEWVIAIINELRGNNEDKQALCLSSIAQFTCKLRRIIVFSLVVSYIGLFAQPCNYNMMKTVLTTAMDVMDSDNPTSEELTNAKRALEEMLTRCSNKTFSGKDSLEFNYEWQLKDICYELADFEGYIQYLKRISHSSFYDRENDPLRVDFEIARINKNYGPLRVRFVGEELKEMAVLKSVSGDDTSIVTVHFLPTRNAWERDPEKDRKMRRLEFLQEQIRAGDFPFFFDSYDQKEGYFYFELPYVPYLKPSPSSEGWYAITFDQRKRYRVNFHKPGIIQEINPEENWFLEARIPDKWVKITFPKRLTVKFRDLQTRKFLQKEEYIRILQGEEVDYYLPSDRELEIVVNTPGDSFHYYLSKLAYVAATAALLLAIL